MKKIMKVIVDTLVGTPAVDRSEENARHADTMRCMVHDLAGSEEAATEALRELSRAVEVTRIRGRVHE